MNFIITALGITQIIGYGTLYYSYAILAPSIATEYATNSSTLFAIFSTGLLLAGLVAPELGRRMDRHNPPTVMMAGSLAVSLALAGIGLAPNLAWFAVLVVLQQIISAAVLYEAAFAALVFFGGPGARRAITHLTLFGAVASTIFWPLTGWLNAEFGWRTAWLVYAVVHLAIAFPLHSWLWLKGRRMLDSVAPPVPARPLPHPPLTGRDAQIAFLSIAAGFALSGAVVAALGVHMVLILQALGLGTAAYAASMVMGPMQAVIRLADAVLFQRFHPLSVAILSGLALPAAVLILFAGASPLLAGVLFAAFFGISQGLASVVKGSVPLALFGEAGYAMRLGRLAAVRAVPTAAAPFLFAVLHETAGMIPSLIVLAIIGGIGAVPLIAVRDPDILDIGDCQSAAATPLKTRGNRA